MLIKGIFSNKVGLLLIQSLFLLLVVIGLLWWQQEPLHQIYWGPLKTHIGVIVNATIAALFLVAGLRALYLHGQYVKEYQATIRFQEQLDFGLTEAGMEPDDDSLIVQRYRAVQQARRDQIDIQPVAWSGMLWGQEATRLGLIRLIQSLLILLGVFGTVASLFMALLGASDLFASPQSAAGILAVVRGMATALSTTMTAIAAYLILAFVFSRLVAGQTHVCHQIESITLHRLLTPSTVDPSDLPSRISELLTEMREAQQALTRQLGSPQHQSASEQKSMLAELERIRLALARGFRLHDSQ